MYIIRKCHFGAYIFFIAYDDDSYDDDDDDDYIEVIDIITYESFGCIWERFSLYLFQTQFLAFYLKAIKKNAGLCGQESRPMRNFPQRRCNVSRDSKSE